MTAAPRPVVEAEAPAPPATVPAWRTGWRARYGRRWGYQLAGLCLAVAIGAALTSLGDPDLPMHLAVGEWIVRHHAVPTVEPFAWTRMGAPYYAYSWLMEVTFYLALAVLGPLGLHLLYGLLAASTVAVMILLGRAAGWRPQTSVAMGVLNLAVAMVISPMLRPHVVLLTLLPAAWACAFFLVRGQHPWRAAAALTLVSALAANTHLFFVLTAAPGVLLITEPVRDRRRAALLVGSVLVGWMLTPYALVWPAIFRLNLAPNVLLRWPSPIHELWPGFQFGLHGGAFTTLLHPLALALAVLPWLLGARSLTGRQRFGYGALWLVGLVVYAVALRALLIWWVLVLPLAGVVVERLGDALAPETAFARHARIVAVWALAMLAWLSSTPRGQLAAFGAEGDVHDRRLPVDAYASVEPVARWLQCYARGGGRVYTIFNFGSYVTWRLPAYSASIDTRSIFPDSVATAETYRGPSQGVRPLGPWRSADLAIVPTSFAVAPVLDTAAGWHRVATVNDGMPKVGPVGLWVRDAWWSRVARVPLPAHPRLLWPETQPPAGCSTALRSAVQRAPSSLAAR